MKLFGSRLQGIFGEMFAVCQNVQRKKRPKRVDYAMIESGRLWRPFVRSGFLALPLERHGPWFPADCPQAMVELIGWCPWRIWRCFFFQGKKKVFSDHFGAHRDCRNSFGVDNYNFRNAGGQCFGDAQPSQLSLPELAEGPYFILANLGTSRVAKMGRHCRDCVMISLWLSLLPLSLFYDILRMFRV